MTERLSRHELMRRKALLAQERAAEDRRKHPYLYVRPTDDLLFVENVAQVLGCSIDYVRRIPRRELPASRCGARLQYMREDVIAFVRRNRDLGENVKADLNSLNPQTPFDAVREDYDPVADSRRQLGGKPKR